MAKAKLIQVMGDTENFADILGTTGELRADHEPPQFKTNNDVINLLSKNIIRKENTIEISTVLGNTFTFSLLKERIG